MTEKNFRASRGPRPGSRASTTCSGGGFPRNRMYLVEGDPGAGKTTLALQFLLAGAQRGEPGVYVTLSETEEELRDVARSHGWSLDGITICDLQARRRASRPTQYTLFHPSEVELSETTARCSTRSSGSSRCGWCSTRSPRCGCWPATRCATAARSWRSSTTSPAARCTVLLLDYGTSPASSSSRAWPTA